MPLYLGPRIYGQNFKWGVLPSNKIDTVVERPNLNVAKEDTDNHVLDVTTVKIKNNDGEIDTTLPIADGVLVNRAEIVYNYERDQPLTKDPKYMGIGNVACVVATGSVTFELDNPLPMYPTAKIHCEGTTYYTNRGSRSYSDIKGLWDGEWEDVPSWIRANASGSETWTDKSTDSTNRGMYDDPTLVDYTKSSVPLYPWVKRIIPTSGSGWVFDEKPLQQDVLTTWVDMDKSNHWALKEHWNFANSDAAVSMWPPRDDIIFDGRDVSSTAIRLRNKTVPITTDVIKIDDYTYRVDFSIPVRYTYYAASQYYTAIVGIRTYHNLDNYCFMDIISKLQIELVTKELKTEYIDLSYSLDDDGQLTENVINTHPLSITANELITSGAYWGSEDNLWTEAMPKYLLTKFKDGKYVVECEVPASWAISNNIHINSTMFISLQNNAPIAREGTNCEFEVKTIEKRYSNNNYIYALRLMEV